MSKPEQREKVDRLLQRLGATEPVIYELGTPQIAETDEVAQLIALGPDVVPYLIEKAATETPKVVACIALLLGRLGAAEALEPLRRLQTEYESREPKNPWHYAVIGQCKGAIKALEKGQAG